MGRLNVKALAIALGVAWGFLVLFVGWTSIFGWGNGFVEVMKTIYIGYASSLAGGVIGGLWGFIDGAICGVIIALVYNGIAGKKD